MNVMDRLNDALKPIKGYGEIRFGINKSLILKLHNGKSEMVNNNDLVGGNVRILLPNRGWGFAVFNRIEDIDRAIKDATDASLAIIPDEKIELAKIEPVVAEIKISADDDARNHSLQEKYELLRKYDELTADIDSRIGEKIFMFTQEFIDRYLLTTEGTRLIRHRADCVLRSTFRAKDANSVQNAFKSFATRGSFDELTKKDDAIIDVARKSAELLDARTVKGNAYTVVLNPGLAGVFIHEAFGHLSESDFVESNPQAQKMMTLGRKFGPEFLNVFDDGSVVPELRGTINYDDEGVPAERTSLIRDGVLVGRLHSRQTAGKMGEKPTGNARAQDFRYAPIVRMTGTAIEKGPHPAAQIFDGIKEGIYAVDAYGGETELENFSFSAGYGYMIRNGKIAEMVKDVVLQGNLFETLANIEQIGDDFKWDSGGGYCGKDGQRAKTSEGSPHIRIKNVIIAGK
ncbi:TldD/PmbA family protein [bacterium]|nr:TldD/PmbA family protein [bacterium]